MVARTHDFDIRAAIVRFWATVLRAGTSATKLPSTATAAAGGPMSSPS
jgi:hypothetical protein